MIRFSTLKLRETAASRRAYRTIGVLTRLLPFLVNKSIAEIRSTFAASANPSKTKRRSSFHPKNGWYLKTRIRRSSIEKPLNLSESCAKTNESRHGQESSVCFRDWFTVKTAEKSFTTAQLTITKKVRRTSSARRTAKTPMCVQPITSGKR